MLGLRYFLLWHRSVIDKDREIYIKREKPRNRERYNKKERERFLYPAGPGARAPLFSSLS